MTNDTLKMIMAAFKDVDITDKYFSLKSLFKGLHPDDRVQPLKDWAMARGKGDDEFAFKLEHAYRRWLADELLGGWPESVSDLVTLFMDHRQITVAFNGLLSSPQSRGKTLDLSTITSDMSLIIGRIGVAYSDRALGNALKRYIDKAKDGRIKDALGLLDGSGPVKADVEWDKLVDAFADTTPGKGSRNYVKRLLQTTMWQIKRRLADAPEFTVYDHLMVVLCGPQRSGKTTIWTKIMEPIRDCVAPTNCAAVIAGKDLELPRFPVLFLDEMASFERSDMEAFKNCVTREFMTDRVLYTNGNATARVRNTFIGATNGTLADKVNDATGLRRFGAIHTKHTPYAENVAAGLPVVDFEALMSVDVLALWRSVDWRAEHPLQSDDQALAEWLSMIEGERNQDNVEAWLRQLDQSEFSGSDGFTTSDLFIRPLCGYRDWCKEHGYQPGSAGKLGRSLTRYKGEHWYPFHPPVAHKRGTVHRFKEAEMGSLVTPLFSAKASAMMAAKAVARQGLGNRPG